VIEDEIIVGEIEMTCSGFFFLSVLHFYNGEWKKDNQTNKKNIHSNTNIRFVSYNKIMHPFLQKIELQLFQMARF